MTPIVPCAEDWDEEETTEVTRGALDQSAERLRQICEEFSRAFMESEPE